MIEVADYFLFEQNIVYEIKALPFGLSFREMTAIRDKVFIKHLEHCDADIQESIKGGTHLSFKWENMLKAEAIVNDLNEKLKPFTYVQKIGLGMYHGNMLVLYVDHNSPDFKGQKIPWFYKGFTIKYCSTQIVQ